MSGWGRFLWGAASSAYQVEGGWQAGGRGLSKWDLYTNRDRVAEKVSGTQGTGNVAINQYSREQYLKDIATMRDLGIDAYRFSVSWPRVLPEGVGRVNQVGLDYYSRLIDDLIANGIEPIVTLYHWDFPEVLQEQGGFRNRAVIDWFRAYADVVFAAVGDRVSKFITMNEPFIDLMMMDCAADNVRNGRPPFPLHNSQWALQVPAMHHLLLASAATIASFRASGRKGEIGIALPLSPARPADPARAEDVAVAKAWDAYYNRWPLDAAVKGIYADDVLAVIRSIAPDFAVSDADRALLAANKVDFLGINYYSPHMTRFDPAHALGADWRFNPDPHPAFNGPDRPNELHDLLLKIRDEYGNCPTLITENGAGFGPGDEVMDGNVVKDPLRESYLRRHIAAALAARDAGADLRGYMEWCLFDNFEWIGGYGSRFGIVHVDFETQKRTPKQSFAAYRDIIAAARR
jgi:beta-glucosidase